MIINSKTLKTIPNWEDQTCFACGAKNPHGLQMKFSTDSLKVFSFMQVPAAMTGWDQTVHGGVLSTILDEIMGWAVIYLLKKIGVTKSMTVDFIKSVNSDDRLTIVGALQEKQSERSALMTGEIYNADDILCVKATGRFTIMQPKAAVRLGLVGNDYMRIFGSILTFDYDR